MTGIIFPDQCIADIKKSIHSTARGDRLALLGDILRSWEANELKEHLSLETNEDKERRKYRLGKALKAAKALSEALDALNDFDRAYVDHHAEHEVFAALKPANTAFIPVAERAIGSSKPGHPRVLVPYLVVLDAAAIYKCLTGKEATRTEAEGAFTHFCTPIWNAVFGEKKSGFTAAMKKLEGERKAGRGVSPIIANLCLRQPKT
ncbi:hypothetical protein [Sphingorhabdus sp.]|uniref:hypothetical protein n=1 Tax=Sphingorhabdus sp. TaxID=1902408 RepID=UPI003341F90B